MKSFTTKNTIATLGFLAAILGVSSLNAQDIVVPISDEGLVESTNCDNAITVTDSNAGEDGAYLSEEMYEMTVCFNTLVGDSIQIQVLPQQGPNDTLNLWDVDENSTLTIFAGEGTDGEQLGVFNSFSDPDGFFLTTIVPCVTLVWTSGEESSGLGFIANFNCLQDLQPFNLDLAIAPPYELTEDTIPDIGPDANVVTFCFGDTLNLTALTSFPLSDAAGDGYEQLTEECNFIWEMGNGEIFEGIGLTELEYGYPAPGGYLATLTVVDVEGQEEFYELYVLMAPRPIFSNIVFGDTLCLGDTTLITGGILFPDTVGVAPNTSIVQPNYDFTDSRFLPDGNGEEYETVIEIEGFTDDPIITNPEDFVSICLNMEHTYLGDLEAWLTCPNGQTSLLFDGFNGPGGYPGNGFGGGNTFLGDANDDGSEAEGIGFDYCFSDLGPLETMEVEFNNGNTVPVNSFPPGGNAMVAGSYLPAEEFATNLAGCPVNGDWTLTIRDNIGADNGYIFNWSMEFNPEFELDTIFYTPDLINTFWVENEDIVVNTDTSVTIVPQTAGNNQYTFVVEDSFGCIHDTTFTVFVRPLPVLEDRTACDRTDVLAPENAPVGGIYGVVETPGEDSGLTFGPVGPQGQVDISIDPEDLYGIYTVEFTEQICGVDSGVAAYRDLVEIDFRPYPQIAPFFEDSVLCGGASILIDAGLQEENSDNFIINWTLDGNTFNAEDLSVSINQSGLYELTIFEPACPDSVLTDQTEIIAIEVNFEGDTICGLVPRIVQVEVQPESIGGSWSSDNDGVIFSSPNAVVTDIIPPAFGDYIITYTDVRCPPSDALSRNFKWFEQPDITILPEDPVFCFEEDTLNLTAVLSGEGNGTYFWSMNVVGSGAPVTDLDVDLDEFQTFPPLTFDPLLDYIVVVETQDSFGKCPEVGRDTLVFNPLACVYNIPNIITPNDDNKNDLFTIQFIENFENASLTIFNRWGQEVFTNNDFGRYQAEQGGWDPEDYKGGVYFYELKLPSIQAIKSGEFTILTEGGTEQ
jgi:gliding motility-associated-like protein